MTKTPSQWADECEAEAQRMVAHELRPDSTTIDPQRIETAHRLLLIAGQLRAIE